MKILASLIIVAMVTGFSATLSAKELKNEKAVKILNKISGPFDPGVQYVVVNKNATIFEHSAGLSDIKENMPLSLSHTMAAFSMTKTITALAVLQLAERNKINIDNKISKYVEHPFNSGITIRLLLNHTSGIPNPMPLKWVHLTERHGDFDENRALAQVLKEHSSSDTRPGEKYLYSNIGYWLLGKLIEKISGKKYTDYVTNNIFEVLSLTPDEIGFLIPNKQNHTKGYLKKWSLMNLFGRFFIDKNVLGNYEGGWLHIKNVYLNGPSFGGVFGSATAFSKILQDLLADQSKLLGEKSKKLLYSKQTIISGEEINMTLGWHIGTLKDVTYYYKEGGGAGFHSEMRIYPEKGIASVLMANRTSFNSRKILSKLDVNFILN